MGTGNCRSTSLHSVSSAPQHLSNPALEVPSPLLEASVSLTKRTKDHNLCGSFWGIFFELGCDFVLFGFLVVSGGCPQVEITGLCPDPQEKRPSNEITQVQRALGSRHAERTLPVPSWLPWALGMTPARMWISLIYCLGSFLGQAVQAEPQGRRMRGNSVSFTSDFRQAT